MKKKYLPFLMGMVAAILLAGCAGRSTGSSAGEGSGSSSSSLSSDPIFARFEGEIERNCTLHVLENDTAKELGYLKHLLEAFNKKYADYGITAVDANIDQYTDLAQDGPAGYGPDVIYQANDMIMKNVSGHHIMPLPTYKIEDYDEFPEAATKAFKREVNGKNYAFGLPVNVQAPFIFYRKDTIPEGSDANNDGTPDMLETWNALYAYSKGIHEQNSLKWGYMKALYDAYFSSGFLFTYGAYVFGPDGTDVSDIGFAKGEAYKGAKELKQLAAIMGKGCGDDSYNTTCYGKLASGEFFATMSTPDVKNNFIKEMILEYQKSEGLSSSDAKKKAEENLVMAPLPKLPSSGDLSEENPTSLLKMKSMGGINGYGVSSYTKYPKAALAFASFASSYEMVVDRNSYLGIIPCRKDANAVAGDLASDLFSRLSEGLIYLMPSLTEVAQIWTPCETLNKDLAADPYRPEGEQKYKSDDDYKKGLEKVSQQISDAIATLGK